MVKKSTTGSTHDTNDTWDVIEIPKDSDPFSLFKTIELNNVYLYNINRENNININRENSNYIYSNYNRYNNIDDDCSQTKTSIISDAITEEELQMIRDEVKKYMTDQMKKDAQDVAGKLFDDFEKLRKEKTAIKRDVTALKKQLQQTKEDINVEIKKMEEMMDKKATELIRFGSLDFS